MQTGMNKINNTRNKETENKWKVSVSEVSWKETGLESSMRYFIFGIKQNCCEKTTKSNGPNLNEH